MRAKCSVFGCKAATYNKIGVLLHFHRFPLDPYRQKVWKELCKNPRINLKSNTTLWMCSLHFEKSCYKNENLKTDAIPTLNLPETGFSFYQQKIRSAIEDESTNSTNEDKGNEKEKGEGEAEETTRDRVKKELQIEIDENDDCGSVSCSNSEDEDEAEARGSNWDKEDSGSNDSQEPQPGTSKDFQKLPVISGVSTIVEAPDFDSPSTSRVLEPQPGTSKDFQKLPVISGVSTIVEAPDFDSPSSSRVFGIPMRSVIDKVVEEHIDGGEEDDCSTFAAHVKTRLKNFDPAQKVIAQKLISDIMFMADTKQLQLTSAIMNSVPSHRVTKAVKNGRPQKPAIPARGSFSSYVCDSDDDDESILAKKRK